MVELYENQGLQQNDAQKIVDIISKPEYQSFFIKTMVNYELGLEIPDNDHTEKKEGSVTFISFICWINTLPYIIFYIQVMENIKIFL